MRFGVAGSSSHYRHDREHRELVSPVLRASRSRPWANALI